MSTTVADAIRRGQRRLAAAGLDTPRLDAEILLRHLLGLDRARLFARLREPVPAAALREYDALIAARGTGAPVAYLTGAREFYGRAFAVRPGVLVPRPETELLVAWALAWLTRRPAATVVDVGTGSGAIPLTLAAELGPAWGGAIAGADRYQAPLAVAAANRDRHGLTGRMELIRGHLLAWCGGPVDLITANLPYLRPEQVAGNPMLAAEPVEALVAGADGLDLIRELIADAPRVLRAGGAIILEIDPSQAEPAAALLRVAFPAAGVAVLPDLAGLSRFVTANLAE